MLHWKHRRASYLSKSRLNVLVEIRSQDIIFPFPIFQQGNKVMLVTNQSDEEQDFCCGPESSEESRLKWNVLISFLIHFSLEAFLWYVHASFMFLTILFTWLLNSWKACSTCRLPVCYGQNETISKDFSQYLMFFFEHRSRVCRDTRLAYRIASVMVIQTVRLETRMSLLLISRSLGERLVRKNFFF